MKNDMLHNFSFKGRSPDHETGYEVIKAAPLFLENNFSFSNLQSEAQQSPNRATAPNDLALSGGKYSNFNLIDFWFYFSVHQSTSALNKNASFVSRGNDIPNFTLEDQTKTESIIIAHPSVEMKNFNQQLRLMHNEGELTQRNNEISGNPDSSKAKNI